MRQVHNCKIMISLTRAIVLMILAFDAAALNATYPTCGRCWCVPDNNGLDPCPTDWIPQSTFNQDIITIYIQQKPKSIFTLNCNPYEESECLTAPAQILLNDETTVCAFKYEPFDDGSSSCQLYSMVTYQSEDDAIADNATITHSGSCGLCSTAQDLAVYLST